MHGHNWTNIGYNNTNCAVDICGYVINDENGNCVWETNEDAIPNVIVQCLPGVYSYTDLTGHYSNLQPVGNRKLLAADGTPLNNLESRSTEVVGSYDPNDKAVKPEGTGAQGIIQRSDSVLNYTIHFQNTGTFMAENVVITDTLDNDLDVKTIVLGAASHSYQLEFRSTNILLLKFMNINLPDSHTNEKASHGMVTFYIKQKKGLADGTQFKNKAAIYFDFNLPIITNTTTNTLVKFLGIEEVKEDVLRIYPNPAQQQITVETSSNTVEDADVLDNMGRKMGNIKLYPNTRNNVNVAPLVDGIYFVKVNGKELAKSFVKIGQ